MRWLVAAALAAGPLAGCAADRPFRPGGQGAAGATAPAASAPATVAPHAETVPVDARLRVAVELPSGLDADRTKIVETFRDVYAGKLRSVVTRGRDDAYLALMDLEAGKGSYEWVREFVDQRRSLRGEARLHSFAVTALTGDGAQVDVCVDESGLRLTDARRRALAEQPAWYRAPRSIYLQSAAMHRGDDDVWRIRLYRHAAYPDERAKGCRR